MSTRSVDPSASATPQRMDGQIPVLDGVRGVAILMVLGHQFNVMTGAYRDDPLPALGFRLLMDAGWIGVELFFVLSGFLITGILLDSRGATNYFRSFWGRRALRIFPPYYVLLLFMLVVLPALTGRRIEGSEHQIWYWLYLSNWVEPFGRIIALLPHPWSLAVEEQFYLLWPLVIFLLSSRGLLRLCAALFVLSLVSRLLLLGTGQSPEAVYMFTVCRMDALACGAAAAVVIRDPAVRSSFEQNPPRLGWAAAGVLLGTILLTRGARTSWLTETVGYSGLSIGFALGILFLVCAGWGRGNLATRALSQPFLRAMGRYSYAMYLFHFPIHQMIGMPLLSALDNNGERGVLTTTAYFLVASVATFVAAFISYHTFERQMLRQKSRFKLRWS